VGLRRGRSVLASVALVGMGVMSPGSVTASTAAQTLSHSVRALPFAPTHVLSTTLSFPPDTAYCQANLGISCYQPAQFQKAYDLQPLYSAGLTGAGKTIVIVDAFGSPTIAADLQHFDQTFGLPDPPSFKEIEPAGAVPPYPSDPFGAADRSGWATETTLDVEWSHVMAPGANILLVATPASETEGVQGFPEIVAAENYVIDHNLGDVISQSFGATEQTFPNPASDIAGLRSAFINAAQHNVTVLASSGDAGATNAFADGSCCYPFPVNSWPSSDPLVTSVGGTQLSLDAVGNRLAPDVVWNDGRGAPGGGVSSVFSRPAFQNHVSSIVGGARGTPDVSLSAAVNGGVDLYYSFCDYRRPPFPLCGGQWHIAGGTSEASPLFAGIVAIADQAAGHRLGWLNPLLYAHPGENFSRGLVDITSGNNSFAGVTGFNATFGYDLASGIGTIDAAKFVRAFSR
jgi:subtilase family serine protease